MYLVDPIRFKNSISRCVVAVSFRNLVASCNKKDWKKVQGSKKHQAGLEHLNYRGKVIKLNNLTKLQIVEIFVVTTAL